MTENLPVRVEVWPIAADAAGLWLISGRRPWLTPNVPADSEPHAEVAWTLGENGIAVDHWQFIHSTSWRMVGPALVVSYVAVIASDDFAPATWPAAAPITESMATYVGPARSGPAVAPPAPRHIDVLMHCLRHLRFLFDHDVTARDTLGPEWVRHLAGFDPVLAGMYGQAAEFTSA